MHTLIEAWRTLDVEAGAAPYILPADRDLLEPDRQVRYSGYADYQSRSGSDPKGTRLHVNLLPMPYMGNLQTASIVLLMLNPRFNPGDYTAELDAPLVRESLVRNLRQEPAAYPFVLLDTDNDQHPGYHYWEQKFRPIATKLGTSQGWAYEDALRLLANQIAVLELVPYHSSKGPTDKWVRRLPSVNLAVDYARSELERRATNGSTLVIVLRGAHRWDLTDSEHVKVYLKHLAQSASLNLSPKSKCPGGPAILRHLDRLGLSAPAPAHPQRRRRPPPATPHSGYPG